MIRKSRNPSTTFSNHGNSNKIILQLKKDLQVFINSPDISTSDTFDPRFSESANISPSHSGLAFLFPLLRFL